MSGDQVIQYGILIGYFSLLFIIGIIASRRIKSLSDFFVGGKKHGYWAVAFSARATGESAWLLLGLTGLGAFVGASAFWVVLGEILGVGFAWLFMAKPFKRATDRYRSITVPDYLVSHFTRNENNEKLGRVVRIIAAGALTVFVTIYVSAQIDATGKAFEDFLGWNYYTGIMVGFGIVLIYTFAGGFVAVVWSDLLQGTMMLLGLMMLPVAAYWLLPSSLGFWDAMAGVAPGFDSFWGAGGANLTNLLVIISYLGIGIGFMGSPQIFVRFMAIKGEEEIHKGRWVALAFTLLSDVGAVTAGMLGRYLLVGSGADLSLLGAAGENVLPILVEHLFPITVVSLYIAAVLAAIMSTVDSLLVIASSAATRDFYQQLYHPDMSDEAMGRLSRRITLLISLIALGVALSVAMISPDRTIFWFVIFGWSGIAATFCPVMLLSIFWPRCNIRGAIAAMVVGFVSVPLYKFAAPLIPGLGTYFAQLGELAPSVITALGAGILVTLATSGRSS